MFSFTKPPAQAESTVDVIIGIAGVGFVEITILSMPGLLPPVTCKTNIPPDFITMFCAVVLSAFPPSFQVLPVAALDEALKLSPTQKVVEPTNEILGVVMNGSMPADVSLLQPVAISVTMAL